MRNHGRDPAVVVGIFGSRLEGRNSPTPLFGATSGLAPPRVWMDGIVGPAPIEDLDRWSAHGKKPARQSGCPIICPWALFPLLIACAVFTGGEYCAVKNRGGRAARGPAFRMASADRPSICQREMREKEERERIFLFFFLPFQRSNLGHAAISPRAESNFYPLEGSGGGGTSRRRGRRTPLPNSTVTTSAECASNLFSRNNFQKICPRRRKATTVIMGL